MLALLDDPNMETATREILPFGKTRPEIQREIKAKNAAQEYLARKCVAMGALRWQQLQSCVLCLCAAACAVTLSAFMSLPHASLLRGFVPVMDCGVSAVVICVGWDPAGGACSQLTGQVYASHRY